VPKPRISQLEQAVSPIVAATQLLEGLEPNEKGPYSSPVQRSPCLGRTRRSLTAGCVGSHSLAMPRAFLPVASVAFESHRPGSHAAVFRQG
jgi:hypothetical protein